MNKYGFTLIELLVVIAIIAILASILFPVFAQAKLDAKKAVSISNLKQITLAGMMYTNDYDDLNPLECGYYAPWGGWDYNDTFDMPADWEAGIFPDLENNDEAVSWGNSIYPYVKSYAIFQDPVGTPTPTWYGTVARAKMPQYSSYTYNGLLTQYPTTSVVSPSQLTEFSIFTGGTPNLGEGITSPVLACPQRDQPCVYQPATSPCPGGYSPVNGGSSFTTNMGNWGGSDTTTTAWIYGHGMPFAMADGHVKWRPLAGNLGGLTDYHVDPWNYYNAHAYPVGLNGTGQYSVWYEQNGCHVLLFRPDFDFTNWGSPLASN